MGTIILQEGWRERHALTYMFRTSVATKASKNDCPRVVTTLKPIAARERRGKPAADTIGSAAKVTHDSRACGRQAEAAVQSGGVTVTVVLRTGGGQSAPA